jgi:hypothetical protein
MELFFNLLTISMQSQVETEFRADSAWKWSSKKPA